MYACVDVRLGVYAYTSVSERTVVPRLKQIEVENTRFFHWGRS